jgi:uncharacterized membrane protein
MHGWGPRATLVAALLAGAACGSRDADSAAAITCDRQPPLNYGNFGKGYLELHCTSCHSAANSETQRSGAPVGVDFDSYSDVVQHVALIDRESVGADPPMPPAGGPTRAELALFHEWLVCAVWPDHDALEENGQL